MSETQNVEVKIRTFESQILYFNGMYGLPVAPYPSVARVANDEMIKASKRGVVPPNGQGAAIVQRLKDFKSILSKEISEADDIIKKVEGGSSEKYGELELLTDIADLLGDIQVYCASEMAKYGIPIAETLRLIMSSNFSKLGPNGEPILDTEGKVQKGPGYWKPEPQIKAMLQEKIEETKHVPTGIIWRE